MTPYYGLFCVIILTKTFLNIIVKGPQALYYIYILCPNVLESRIIYNIDIFVHLLKPENYCTYQTEHIWKLWHIKARTIRFKG